MNATAMTTYVLEPLAPLVVRSGRPFDGQAGADAARFPPPSTLAGALRTALAESSGQAFSPALSEIPVNGPLPVKLDDAGAPVSLLVPKPADALYFWDASKSAKRVVRAQPAPFAAGEGADLDAGLLPVTLADEAIGKPAPGPRWWSFADFELFRNGADLPIAQLVENGWTPLADEIRTHVGIDPQRQAAANGQLFQTAGLDFLSRGDKMPALSVRRIGLLGRVNHFAGKIETGVLTLGGERRLSAIARADEAIWPTPASELLDSIVAAGGLCLSLLTPALFAAGWRPDWLHAAKDRVLEGSPPGCQGLTLRLRAAALDRWLPHSGWDLAAMKPRAGRKLVPGGAAYWFEIAAGDAEALRHLWLSSVCDDAQDCRDGFGLSLIHPWRPPRAA